MREKLLTWHRYYNRSFIIAAIVSHASAQHEESKDVILMYTFPVTIWSTSGTQISCGKRKLWATI